MQKMVGLTVALIQLDSHLVRNSALKSTIIASRHRTIRSTTLYSSRVADGLLSCYGFEKSPTLSVFNDIISPNKFDNSYFPNLLKGLGILKSDHGLYSDCIITCRRDRGSSSLIVGCMIGGRGRS